MAFNSFNNKRFRAPMFNRNYPRGNSKMNFNADRFRPQFQRPNVPSRPFQPPESVPPQVFQNRPHFSNFPGATEANNFLSRPPCPSTPHIIPPPSTTTHIHPPPPQQNFHFNSPGAVGANNFMSRPPCPSTPHIIPPPSTTTHIHPSPPQQNFPFNSTGAAGANNFMSRPPCPPSPQHINPPPSTSSTHIHPSPPRQNFRFNSSGAAGVNNFMSRPPCPSSPQHINPPPSTSSTHIHPSPPRQNFRFNSSGAAGVNNFMRRPHCPPSPHINPLPSSTSLQNFRFNSPSSRQRFNGPFDQPFRPLNNPPPFRGRRHPYQNRFRGPVSSRHYEDHSLQPNQKKQKTREIRKLKSWMTDELFAEVKKKNALYLKAKSSDEQTAWQEFRLQRNRVSSLIKEAKIKAGLISRKVKEDDNTEKPFSCDTCDRAFETRDELQDHLSLHIKCDHQNCTFEAHSKIVDLHKKMQHDTGYAEAISKLKDEAEIKRWREERKRRFPTAENIRKRKAEQAEKEARGEVLETKEFGKFKQRTEENGHAANTNNKRMRGRHSRRFRGRKHFEGRQPNQPFDIKCDSDSDSDCDSHILLKRFPGMSSLTNSASNGCKKIKSVENISNSHSSDAQDEIHCPTSHTSLEQNLPKSNTNDADNHSHVQNSDNNASTDTTDIYPLNDECPNDDVELANASVLEIPVDETSKPTQELICIEDSDDEELEIISIRKNSREMAVTNKNSDDEDLEIISIRKNSKEMAVTNKNSDDEDPEVILIRNNAVEVAVADKNSDDEGPELIPIRKNSEVAVTDINSDDEGPEIISTRKNSEEVSVTDKNDEQPLSVASKTAISDEKDSINSNQNVKHSKKQTSRNNKFSKNRDSFSQPRKSSLLEKLLADDIRHERNVILQCVRHIVNNNFFGIGAKK